MDFEGDKQSEEGDLENLDQMLDDLALGDDAVNFQVSKKDTTVFLIDCSQEILTPLQGEEKSQLQLILDGYYNFLQRKIIANAADKVGLIFYNVKNSKNSINHNHIYKVHPLDSEVDAHRIKDASLLFKEFKQRFGGISEEKVSLNYVLWEYGTQINNFSTTNYHLRVFLFTTDDCPHPIGDQDRQPSIKRARELAAKNVQIQLFPIRKSKKCNFDIRKFYQEIITFDPEEINSTLLDNSSKILDLQERLRQKEFKKRTLNRLIMKVGKEGDNFVEVAIKIYSFFTKAKKPCPKKVEAKTNRLLVRQVKKINAKGEQLFDGDLGYYYPLGGQKIKFTKEDMNKIKNIEPPGMTLIGFKPKNLIKPYFNIRTSYFIYPDEEHISGSSQFFDSLINDLSQRNLVGIVKIVPRNNQEMRFGALLPQAEKFDEEDHFQTPPGFHMIILPYAQDIVNFVGEKTVVKPTEISAELLQVTKLLINNLTIPNFDFRDFQNPSLQKFYSHLQAHALNQKDVQERPDLLQPDTQGFANFTDIIQLVKETVNIDVNYGVSCNKNRDPEELDDEEERTPRPTKKSRVKKQDVKLEEVKRVPSKNTKPKIQEDLYVEQVKQKKKPNKSSKAVEDDDQQLEFMLNIESIVQNNKGNILKVPDLKRYLEMNGLSIQGTKDKLIKRTFDYIQKKYTIGGGSI